MTTICHPRNLLLCPCSVLQTSSRWSHLTPFPSDCTGKMASVGVSKGSQRACLLQSQPGAFLNHMILGGDVTDFYQTKSLSSNSSKFKSFFLIFKKDILHPPPLQSAN